MQEPAPLYRYSWRFYGWQLLLLALGGLFCFWFSRNEWLDHALSDWWYDPVLHRFPLEDNYWLDLINHRLLKYIVITTGVLLLLGGMYRKKMDWVMTALQIGIGAGMVGLLKSHSLHSCPWDLAEYGGHAIGYPLLSAASAFPGPGHCFPGGHASSGFGLMALFFLFYPRNRKVAHFVLLAAIILGLVMGYGQVMRGAHFFSHNLWSWWWVWCSQVVFYGLVSSGIPVRYQVTFQHRCARLLRIPAKFFQAS